MPRGTPVVEVVDVEDHNVTGCHQDEKAKGDAQQHDVNLTLWTLYLFTLTFIFTLRALTLSDLTLKGTALAQCMNNDAVHAE